MSRKIRLPKLEVHPLFWLIGALSILTAQFESVFIIFILVFLHECAHIFMMMKYKWKIRRIMLLPFGGVAETDEFATRPFYEDWYVVLAGPLFHIALELFFQMLIIGFHVPTAELALWRETNQMILLVNLLPIYPLDGGRILTLVLEQKFPYYTVFVWSAWFGMAICIICILFFIVFHATSIGNIFVFFYLLVYLFLIWRKRMYIFLRFLYMRVDQKNIKDFPLKTIFAWSNERMLQVCKRFYRPANHQIILQDTNDHKEVPESIFLKVFLYQSFEPKTVREARKYF